MLEPDKILLEDRMVDATGEEWAEMRKFFYDNGGWEAFNDLKHPHQWMVSCIVQIGETNLINDNTSGTGGLDEDEDPRDPKFYNPDDITGEPILVTGPSITTGEPVSGVWIGGSYGNLSDPIMHIKDFSGKEGNVLESTMRMQKETQDLYEARRDFLRSKTMNIAEEGELSTIEARLDWT